MSDYENKRDLIIHDCGSIGKRVSLAEIEERFDDLVDTDRIYELEQENKRLREALSDLLDCIKHLEPCLATVSKAEQALEATK